MSETEKEMIWIATPDGVEAELQQRVRRLKANN